MKTKDMKTKPEEIYDALKEEIFPAPAGQSFSGEMIENILVWIIFWATEEVLGFEKGWNLFILVIFCYECCFWTICLLEKVTEGTKDLIRHFLICLFAAAMGVPAIIGDYMCIIFNIEERKDFPNIGLGLFTIALMRILWLRRPKHDFTSVEMDDKQKRLKDKLVGGKFNRQQIGEFRKVTEEKTGGQNEVRKHYTNFVKLVETAVTVIFSIYTLDFWEKAFSGLSTESFVLCSIGIILLGKLVVYIMKNFYIETKYDYTKEMLILLKNIEFEWRED